MKAGKRLGFLMFVLVAAGCAITDYGTITDNNQISGKRLGQFGGVQPVVDTKGAAHFGKTLFATTWPDGTDELIHFIDQAADATAVLTTYNNFSTGIEPVFHDDLYCDTDRVGCSIFTAPDNNDDNRFDGVLNSNCSGARSLMFLLATGRYYGECGRRREPKLDIASKVRLLNLGRFASRFGMEGLLYDIDASNMAIRLTDERDHVEVLPFRGAMSYWRHQRNDHRALLDFRDARLGAMLEQYASWLERRDPEVTTVTIDYHGISTHFTIGQNREQGIGYERILERSKEAF